MDARQLIETCHKAWTTGDFVTARRCLADNLDFKGSIDTYKKADDFINALQGFKRMLRGIKLLKSYFDHSGGAKLNDCDTATSAGVIRTSESSPSTTSRSPKFVWCLMPWNYEN